MQIRFTPEAERSIGRTVAKVSESNPGDLQKSIDFVSDIGDTFEYLQGNGNAGTAVEFTAYENTRYINLLRYTGFLLIFTTIEDELLIIDLVYSWMPS